jgi:hypothetical protein
MFLFAEQKIEVKLKVVLLTEGPKSDILPHLSAMAS